MTDPLRACLAAVEDQATEMQTNIKAFSGADDPAMEMILRLVQMLRRCVEAMDQARRESASEPKSVYARAATIILNTALTDLAALCERGKG